jgi:hypothetical protein
MAGDIMDCAGRKFNNITAFRYAVWALDWHMWKMILKYLPEEKAKRQIEGLNNGEWVAEHGTQVSWQNLIDALQTYINSPNWSNWSSQQKIDYWGNQVGGQQLLLPAHVINEYRHPTRPFDPCPLYGDNEPVLPRTGVADWITKEQWGLSKAGAWTSGKSPASCGGAPGVSDKNWRTIKADIATLTSLLETRRNQSNTLINILRLANPQPRPQ